MQNDGRLKLNLSSNLNSCEGSKATFVTFATIATLVYARNAE